MGQSVSVQQNINQSIQIKFKEDVFGPEEQKIPTSYLTFILKEKKIVNAVSSFSSSFEKKRKHYEGSCSVFFSTIEANVVTSLCAAYRPSTSERDHYFNFPHHFSRGKV